MWLWYALRMQYDISGMGVGVMVPEFGLLLACQNLSQSRPIFQRIFHT